MFGTSRALRGLFPEPRSGRLHSLGLFLAVAAAAELDGQNAPFLPGDETSAPDPNPYLQPLFLLQVDAGAAVPRDVSGAGLATGPVSSLRAGFYVAQRIWFDFEVGLGRIRAAPTDGSDPAYDMFLGFAGGGSYVDIIADADGGLYAGWGVLIYSFERTASRAADPASDSTSVGFFLEAGWVEGIARHFAIVPSLHTTVIGRNTRYDSRQYLIDLRVGIRWRF